MPRKPPHKLVQKHVRRALNQAEGNTVDHLYGTSDRIGIRLVTRVAVTVEAHDGSQKSAVPTGVTAIRNGAVSQHLLAVSTGLSGLWFAPGWYLKGLGGG